MTTPDMNAEKTATTLPEPSQAVAEAAAMGDQTFYGKSHFHHMLRVERKRTERSRKPFLLVLLDISALTVPAPHQEMLEKIKTVLISTLREVDIRGWYDHNKTIGVIFTEMVSTDVNTIERIIHKIYGRFCQGLDTEWVKKIRISFHVYPETNGGVSIKEPFDISLYPDLKKGNLTERISMTAKKMIDITGSAAALLLFSPLFLMIAVAVKATTRGPVFFRQERLGLNGKPFSFLKFRSMYTDCDNINHKEYITRFIHDKKSAAVKPGVFKLTGDPRVTPVGGFLRKTSLDELPQFINVLKGEMSLVGPRPPIPYECELYDIWHRRRLLSCKPGITGLWQVTGRSSTTFDEMVRLDLKYIHEWNLWLDLKILFMTPKVVFSGKGAY
jgi:lipopolysaccharide/colanic/teichoic acid biosynthesis glycosyltransferase